MAAPAKVPRKVDKNLLAQRRQEERQRQQMILEEMKKPTEDMCLGDHQVCERHDHTEVVGGGGVSYLYPFVVKEKLVSRIQLKKYCKFLSMVFLEGQEGQPP